jgi:hypothetical protein
MPLARPLIVLTLAVVTLMALASCAGLLIDDVYHRDTAMVRAGWLGNDLITLLVATPLLLGSVALAPRVMRARLIWLGMLAYVVYNFAFYLVGAAFNSLFLIYAALVAGGALALVGGVATLDFTRRPLTPMPSRRVTVVAIYTGGVALLLGAFWVAVTVHATMQGTVPAMVTATNTHTNITGALDLTLVVAPGLLAGWWLWTGHRWGYVLAVIWNVKGAAYMAALTAATLTAFQSRAIDDATLAALWGTIGLGCAIATLALLVDPAADD